MEKERLSFTEIEESSFPRYATMSGTIKEVHDAMDFIDDVCCRLEDTGLDSLVTEVSVSAGSRRGETLEIEVKISSEGWKPGCFDDYVVIKPDEEEA